MADNENQLGEAHAIAKLTDNYKFDLEKKEHREILRTLTKIAEKRVENEPEVAKVGSRHSQRMFMIAVLALIVTISFMIWTNHLNHTENVQLEEQRLHQR